MAEIKQFIFFDFEMLCSNRGIPFSKMEAIRIGAVKYDIETEQIHYFDRFIQPINRDPLSDFCKKLTGVQEEDLENAANFPSVMKDFFTWVGGIKRSRFFSWSPSDMQRLQIDGEYHRLPETMLKKVEQRYIDFQAIFSKRVANSNLSVENALRLYGLSFIGQPHNPMYDAYNTLRIYLCFHKQVVLSDFIMVKQFILGENQDLFTMQAELKNQFQKDLLLYIADLQDIYRLKDGKKILKRTERFIGKYENILINRSRLFDSALVESIRSLVTYYHDLIGVYQEHLAFRSEVMIVDEPLLNDLKQLSSAI